MVGITGLLERELGLDVSSVGSRALEAAIRRRLAVKGCDLPRYANEVKLQRAELDALIDELVVPETWFFRDGAPFRLLARRAVEFVAAKPLRPFRVLSMPCATGEEPYSIAICLVEAGLRLQQFAITAYDVSARNIETARLGTYGKGSFRGPSPFALTNYLELDGAKQTVIPALRNAVRFVRKNVLDRDLAADEPRFDVIFCRNLLIYLTPAARTQVVGVIDRCLHEDGIVIVGHAEAIERIDPKFRPTVDVGAFAYARGITPITAPLPQWIPPTPVPMRARPAPDLDERELGAPPSPSVTPPELAATLAAATSLADRGQLVEALAMCEVLVAVAPPVAAHYALLGVVQQSRGRSLAAERAFTQALYIDPQHRESLVHLSLLLRGRGQVAVADQLLVRAERARGKA